MSIAMVAKKHSFSRKFLTNEINADFWNELVCDFISGRPRPISAQFNKNNEILKRGPTNNNNNNNNSNSDSSFLLSSSKVVRVFIAKIEKEGRIKILLIVASEVVTDRRFRGFKTDKFQIIYFYGHSRGRG